MAFIQYIVDEAPTLACLAVWAVGAALVLATVGLTVGW